MKSNRWFVGAALLALVVGASYWVKRPSHSISGFADIKSKLRGQGYFFASDSENGSNNFGMLISRNAYNPTQVGHLCKIGPMGPAWQGKIWVTRNPDDWQLAFIPDGAEAHLWGKFIAYGDAELLDEVEDVLSATGG